MTTGIVDPQLQSSAAQAYQQQQRNSISSTEETTKNLKVDETQAKQTPATIVTLGTRSSEQLTYSRPVIQTTAPDSDDTNVVGGIKRPPPEPAPTSTTLSAPDSDESNVVGGIKRPPP